MHQKLKNKAAYAKRISKIRSRTVKPVLGTLIHFLNMRKINTRGMAQANKHVLMAALCYNLKKLMQFSRPKAKALQQRCDRQPNNGIIPLLFLLGFSEPH